ncbi:hypothetical protein O5290_30885, partial [Escherichia coli]|nr:hypothetical protein [Escherichia coli]
YFTEDFFRLVVNSATREKDLSWTGTIISPMASCNAFCTCVEISLLKLLASKPLTKKRVTLGIMKIIRDDPAVDNVTGFT